MTYFELNERYLIIKEQCNKIMIESMNDGTILEDHNLRRAKHYMNVLEGVMSNFSNIDKRGKSLELKGWANAIAEQAISKCYDAIKAYNEDCKEEV